MPDVIPVDNSPYLLANPSVACHDGEHCLVVYVHNGGPQLATDSDIRGSYPGENLI